MENSGSSHPRPSVGVTLLLIIGAFIFMALFFTLYRVLNVGMIYFGLVFLVYWAAILRQDFKTFVPAVMGGIFGIALGWLFIAMPTLAGAWNPIASLTVVILLLFCFMRRHLSVIVNNSTMLYLTVSTISELNIAGNVIEMTKSTLLAAGYMGTVAAIVYFVTRRQKSRATT